MENFISWLLLSKSDICFQPKTVWYIAIISKLCECVCVCVRVCVCVCIIHLQTISWTELQLLIEVGGFNPHVLSFFLAACMAFIISEAVALSQSMKPTLKAAKTTSVLEREPTIQQNTWILVLSQPVTR